MHTNEQWLIDRGFRKQPDGSWAKPKRTVPAVCETPRPKPERTDIRDADKSVPREAIYKGRVLVRVTSFRCGVQLDPDNICPKFFIDCLRYAGVIRDDTSGCIELAPYKEVRVSTKKEEGCLIEVIPL